MPDGVFFLRAFTRMSAAIRTPADWPELSSRAFRPARRRP